MAQIAKALKKDLEKQTVSSPTSTALLCCPFCGGEAKLKINDADLSSKYGRDNYSECHIECCECSCARGHVYTAPSSTTNCEHYEKSALLWNQRAT